MEIIEAMMRLYLAALKWLMVALVAVVAVELGTEYASSALELPYEQAFTLVVGLPALLWVLNWDPKGRSLRPTGHHRGRRHLR